MLKIDVPISVAGETSLMPANMSSTKSTFGTLDIIIFGATLVVSACIGIFFAVKDRRKKNVENYFYGGRKMSPIPVGCSIAVTFISAITLIGYPSDTYLFGLVTFWYCFTLVIPTIIACIYYIPLVHRLHLNTIYEYLGLRFHPAIQKMTSALEIINVLIYMGVIVYLPALALSAVTPISIAWSIIVTSVICTMYTTVGGLKAVVWTDAFQALIMLIGSLSVLIQALIIVGGFGNVWAALERSGRNNIFVFDPNPTIRTTFWTIMVGFSLTNTLSACANQSICQRYLSCRSIKHARIAAFAALLPKITITFISILCGCVLYAFFEGCDPIKSGKIAKSDQMMPYLALEAFKNLPGMSGFFVAAAYSGTLSSVSSGINAAGSLLLEDFIMPCKSHMTHFRQLLIGKITAILLGCFVTAIAFLSSLSSQTIVSIIFSTRGAVGGPMLGVFTLGIFVPWCNTKGAFVGLLGGITCTLWISLGGLINGKAPESLRKLPTSTANCTSISDLLYATSSYTTYPTTTYTVWNNATAKHVDSVEETYNPIQAMSFMYYTATGFLLTVVVGILVSACTGLNDPKKSDPKLFVAIVDNPRLPESVVRFFRFGVPPLNDDSNEEKTEFQPVEMSLSRSRNSSTSSRDYWTKKEDPPLVAKYM